MHAADNDAYMATAVNYNRKIFIPDHHKAKLHS
jgi:hypothetical protein